MKSTRIPALRTAAVVTLLALCGSSARAGYDVIDLHTLGGTYAHANAINGNNQVVGVSSVVAVHALSCLVRAA